MAHVRYFTPKEANALLPRVKPLLAELRDAFHEYRFARQQVDDLRKVYGEDPADVEGHPQQAESHAWHEKLSSHEARVQGVLDELLAFGVSVKDPLLGLIDFYARRENGDTVLLCYRDDEDAIGFWHPVETGFGGRRPLSEL